VNSLDYDASKAGKRWVACFDRLGFGDYCKRKDLVEIFCETRHWLARAKEEVDDEPTVEWAWFSDTVLFYSTDDSHASCCAVTNVSEFFFDEMLVEMVPSRGALAFGEFYADRTRNIFFGEALVDAYKYAETFNWLGFVLHPSALRRMEELGQPPKGPIYKRWKAEIKDGKTKAVRRSFLSVVAHVPGPGTIMPVAGGNPYLAAITEMSSATKCKTYRRKYQNTIRFLQQSL
jgi:hypothetical protein